MGFQATRRRGYRKGPAHLATTARPRVQVGARDGMALFRAHAAPTADAVICARPPTRSSSAKSISRVESSRAARAAGCPRPRAPSARVAAVEAHARVREVRVRRPPGSSNRRFFLPRAERAASAGGRPLPLQRSAGSATGGLRPMRPRADVDQFGRRLPPRLPGGEVVETSRRGGSPNECERTRSRRRTYDTDNDRPTGAERFTGITFSDPRRANMRSGE